MTGEFDRIPKIMEGILPGLICSKCELLVLVVDKKGRCPECAPKTAKNPPAPKGSTPPESA